MPLNRMTTRVFAGAAALGLLLAACNEVTTKQGEARNESSAESATPQTAPASHEAAKSAMKPGLQDGEAIRDALVAWLQQSKLGDRELLLSMTERASVWEGPDALLNIGRWQLHDEAGQLALRMRLSTADGSSQAFVAPLAHDASGWHVMDITSALSHARR